MSSLKHSTINHYLSPAKQNRTSETEYLYSTNDDTRRSLLIDLVMENSMIISTGMKWKLLKRIPDLIDIKEGAIFVEDGTGEYLKLERDMNVFVLVKWAKANTEYFERIE